MGVEMELDFEKYCKLSGSPNTVLPSPCHLRSKTEKRIAKENGASRTNAMGLQKDIRGINFHRYRSSSCKNLPSRISGLEVNDNAMKRGSVYQSSKEVRMVKNIGAVEERAKIEFSRSSATTLSYDIVNSLCNSDEEGPISERGRSIEMSFVSKSDAESCSQDFLEMSFHHDRGSNASSKGFLEIPLSWNDRDNSSAENVTKETIQDYKFRNDPVFGPPNKGNILQELNSATTLYKSLSDKLALPHSPSRSATDCSTASSPKSRFSPMRKMFDPFTKSKSLRSPVSTNEHNELKVAAIRRNKTFRKSLLHDFSNTSQISEIGRHNPSAATCSPAHLHGCLKVENKNGVPLFEFSLKFPEDVFVAKTWKADNGLSWVYTFHSVYNRRKSNVNGWGSKDSSKESPVMGQMQVSSYLCTDLKDTRTFNNSMVTEFVVYDIAHARKTAKDDVKIPEDSDARSVGGTCKNEEVSEHLKPKIQSKQVPDNGSSPNSGLHPGLEIAAIVVQVPVEKIESVMCKKGDAKNDKPRQDEIGVSVVAQKKSKAQINVVTASGNHSLPMPSTESRGPSPILDRWRMAGGCDCGGWDMACPLFVLSNPDIQSTEDYALLENHRPLNFFLQGAKETTPALTISVMEEGLFAVDFHARLSTLQAFSICVAILHSRAEKQLLQCNLLRGLIKGEVNYLIEAVAEEEKKKKKASQKMEEPPPSFVFNPPISPIARV